MIQNVLLERSSTTEPLKNGLIGAFGIRRLKDQTIASIHLMQHLLKLSEVEGQTNSI